MNEHDISKASEELGQNGDELPEMHYCPTSKQKYWKQDDRGLWISYGVDPVRRYLKVRCDFNSSEIDEFLCNVENSKVIDVVTKISGYKKGMHRIDGKSVLVPSEQRRIKPVKGDWSTLEAFYLGMLGEEQFEWLKGWKRHWLDGFYNFKRNTGQVVVFVGPVSCGKTVERKLISHIFDGECMPLEWITGGTKYNGELCEHSHLVVDDGFQDLKAKGKQTLKMYVKQIAVGGAQRFEFKHNQAFSASPLWRMTMACNEDDDSLSVIPELDENIKDKISILHCMKREMPMPTVTSEEQAAFLNQLKKEMPAFLYHLMNEHEVSEEMKDKEDRRMLVRGYHHPTVTKLAEESSYDGQRMVKIIECLKKNAQGCEWVGTPAELLKKVTPHGIERNATPQSIGKLLTGRSKLPVDQVTYLGNKNSKRTYLINLREE